MSRVQEDGRLVLAKYPGHGLAERQRWRYLRRQRHHAELCVARYRPDQRAGGSPRGHRRSGYPEQVRPRCGQQQPQYAHPQPQRGRGIQDQGDATGGDLSGNGLFRIHNSCCFQRGVRALCTLGLQSGEWHCHPGLRWLQLYESAVWRGRDCGGAQQGGGDHEELPGCLCQGCAHSGGCQ
ncbi:hypothetical protein D3C78_1336420 [compost metagenome]